MPLKVRDVKEAKYLSIREKKTSKEKRLPISDELKQIIREYIKGRKDYEYLLRLNEKTDMPITRQRV